MPGNVEVNISRHMLALDAVSTFAADLIIFPELSICGYSLYLAEESALDINDSRLGCFQDYSLNTGSVVVVGAAEKTEAKPFISLFVFWPNGERSCIHKAILHEDELLYFSAPDSGVQFLSLQRKVAIAICYESSVGKHIQMASESGMEIYLASVAKTVAGIEKAHETQKRNARIYGVPVLVSNCCGECEGKPAGGSSIVIDQDGSELYSLSCMEEGFIIFDSESRSAKPCLL